MPCIIHHWDTDGISSAAIITGILEEREEEWQNVSPEIGEFEIPETRIGDSEIYVVDLNLPERIEAIAPRFAKILFFDHHHQKRLELPNVVHVNPNLEGKEYPSASCVISDHFQRWSYLSILGAVGDVGKGVFKDALNDVFNNARIGPGELLELDEKQTMKLVRLIDSNYIVMDRAGVEKAVELLLRKTPSELLEIGKWNRNLERIEREIGGIIPLCEDRGKFCEVFFSSNMNVISSVAKRIVWERKKDVLAVNEDFNGKVQVYFRKTGGSKADVLSMISKLRREGINSGGKKEVLGVICEKPRIERVLEIIRSEVMV